MATSIQIAGPCEVRSIIGGGDAALLGLSDNDSLPQLQHTDNLHEVKTVEHGAVPEEIVHQGTTVTLTVSLVKWDESVLDAILIAQRGGTTQGETIIGRRVSAGDVEIILSASGTGGPILTIPKAYITSDGVTDAQWGNRERVLTLIIRALPDDDNVTYTYNATGSNPPPPP